MMLTGPRQATPLPFGRDARLTYRRLRRPTRLPDLAPRRGVAGWLHALVLWVSARTR